MKIYSIVTASLLSLSLLSTYSNAQDQQHSVGIVAGVASGEYKNSTQDGDGFAQAYLFYNYQALEHFSVELAYNTAAELDNWQCEEKHNDSWTCNENNKIMFALLANEFELNGFVVAIKGHAPISQRNSLYAKLGAQYYDYEFSRNNNHLEGENGIGVLFEAGWQYQWDMGIGMNVGLRYQDMGDLTLKSQNVGISYTF